ncbi:unnamed protein product [Gongylonema pulchrum]|uniref:gamma-glutamylcyclotransferase n=1 Tax=Gongylonema pulchrum TaxID=637853 RepID=A0A183E1R4_9BILA|nr:unnamed protein product [Gongylonema pulchrum]
MAPQELRCNDDWFYYFAYGSNLLDERMHIKNATFEKIGLLPGYRLEFFDYGRRWKGAVASIEQSEDDEVWGCIWRVPWSFSDELDLQEGGYHRLIVDVKAGNATVRCRTYQYSNPARQPGSPSPHYKQVIVSGAVEHHLPLDYIMKLKAVKHNGYKGAVLVDLAAIKNLNSCNTSD